MEKNCDSLGLLKQHLAKKIVGKSLSPKYLHTLLNKNKSKSRNTLWSKTIFLRPTITQIC